MDKKESLELKGIAILLMLMLHLFNTQQRVAECTTFLYFWKNLRREEVKKPKRIKGIVKPKEYDSRYNSPLRDEEAFDKPNLEIATNARK